ncbi:MAG: DUF4296 domain-containing protein [Bacteroidales bacterium]|nr:DUF4296 domain-containing protein [Bacteroidales bacterium]
MKPIRSAILATLLGLICLSACQRKDKIIPRATMADIYADLFIADQWLRDQPDDFVVADTVRFYEPVFRKYGYTTLDFRNSANYYLQDPKRFARILQRTSAKLGERATYLEHLSADIESVRSEVERLKRSASVPAVFYDTSFFRKSALYKMDLQLDERGAWMPVFPSEAPDSLQLADSLRLKDSLLRAAEPVEKTAGTVHRFADERLLDIVR